MYKVFLSSTSKDLEPHRQAIRNAIAGQKGFACVAMEDFGARTTTPRQTCADELAQCQVFVGLVGHLYGSSPPGETTSFTELEYEAAARLPRLMFVATDDFPLKASLIESEDRLARQQAFRDRVSTECTVAHFDHPDPLATRIATALANWQIDTITAELVTAKAELRQALQEKERGAVRDAVADLAGRAGQAEPPPGVEQALALLSTGSSAEAEAIFARVIEQKSTEGQRRPEGGRRGRPPPGRPRHPRRHRPRRSRPTPPPPASTRTTPGPGSSSAASTSRPAAWPRPSRRSERPCRGRAGR